MALYLLDLLGCAVFAISGALTAGRKRMDLFGAVVVAVIAAIGGGTVRDVLLDRRPLFWVEDPTYLAVIVGAAGATLLYGRFLRPPGGSLLVADAFGLAVFTYIGAGAAYASGVAPPIVVLMGTLTGVAGGIMRDVLCAEIPLILRREVYATASVAGGVTYVTLLALGAGGPVPAVLTVAVVAGLRLMALRFDLHVPVFSPEEEGRPLTRGGRDP